MAELIYHPHHNLQGRSEEHRHSAAVLSHQFFSDNSVAGRPMCVDSIHELGFLEYTQVQVDLGHPHKR